MWHIIAVNEFGTWLRKTRREMGVSQAAVAACLGVAQPNVSRIENGLDTNITRLEVVAIANLLNVPESVALEAAGYESTTTPHKAINPEIEIIASQIEALPERDRRYIVDLIERLSQAGDSQGRESPEVERV